MRPVWFRRMTKTSGNTPQSSGIPLRSSGVWFRSSGRPGFRVLFPGLAGVPESSSPVGIPGSKFRAGVLGLPGQSSGTEFRGSRMRGNRYLKLVATLSLAYRVDARASRRMSGGLHGRRVSVHPWANQPPPYQRKGRILRLL